MQEMKVNFKLRRDIIALLARCLREGFNRSSDAEQNFYSDPYHFKIFIDIQFNQIAQEKCGKDETIGSKTLNEKEFKELQSLVGDAEIPPQSLSM